MSDMSILKQIVDKQRDICEYQAKIITSHEEEIQNMKLLLISQHEIIDKLNNTINDCKFEIENIKSDISEMNHIDKIGDLINNQPYHHIKRRVLPVRN